VTGGEPISISVGALELLVGGGSKKDIHCLWKGAGQSRRLGAQSCPDDGSGRKLSLLR